MSVIFFISFIVVNNNIVKSDSFKVIQTSGSLASGEEIIKSK